MGQRQLHISLCGLDHPLRTQKRNTFPTNENLFQYFNWLCRGCLNNYHPFFTPVLILILMFIQAITRCRVMPHWCFFLFLRQFESKSLYQVIPCSFKIVDIFPLGMHTHTHTHTCRNAHIHFCRNAHIHTHIHTRTDAPPPYIPRFILLGAYL